MSNRLQIVFVSSATVVRYVVRARMEIRYGGARTLEHIYQYDFYCGLYFVYPFCLAFVCNRE